MTERDQINSIADRLGAAISSRNADNISAIYDDNVTIWHPAFDSEMGKEENTGLLAKVFQITRELRYEKIRRHPIEGGVIQQHVLTGKFDNGDALPNLQVCMIIKIADQKIIRIEEYFDAATFNSVWERVAEIS